MRSRGDAGGLADGDAGVEPIVNVEDHVIVARVELHGPGVALGVHEHYRQAGLGHDPQGGGTVPQGRHVVDDARPSVGGAAHDLGVAGVDGEGGANLLGEGRDDGDDAPQLLVQADGLGARPGRFPADVEDIGTFGLQLQAMGDGGLRIEPAPAVGEAVGRDVDDAHEARPVHGEPGDGQARLLDALDEGRQLPARAVRQLRRTHDAPARRPALALGDLGRRKAPVLPAGYGKAERRRAGGLRWSDWAQGPEVEVACHAAFLPRSVPAG